jgi:plastocyanin
VRRPLALSLLAGCLLAALAAPAAALSATADVRDNEYLPRELRVVPGETVTWLFKGLQDHTVTSDPGQGESFASGQPQTGGAPFSHKFNALGRFVYRCTVHPDMTGAVTVAPPDLTPPALTRLSAGPSRFCVPGRGCRHPGTRFRFRLSEASRVRGSIATARRPGHRLRRLSASLRAGSRSIRFRGRGLRPGRYVARLQATDGAGNRSPVKRVRFRVQRP